MRSGIARDSGSSMQEMLEAALAGDPAGAGFDVHYQPIVRFDDVAALAVEALPRWNHPFAGRILSSEFVPAAEWAGLLGVLDDFVLERACADARALGAVYGHPVAVHVNISGRRLGRRDLESSIAWVLDRHGLAPCWLTIEIAAAMIAEGVGTNSQARVLHAMGCHMGQGRLFGAPGRLDRPPTR